MYSRQPAGTIVRTGIARSAHGSTHQLCTVHTCMSGVMPSSLSAELTSRACSEYSAASVLMVSLCREGLLPLKGPPAAVAAAGGSAAAACWGCTKRPSARGISISGELAAAARRGLAGLGVPCIREGFAVPRAERPPVAAGAWAPGWGVDFCCPSDRNPANGGCGARQRRSAKGVREGGGWPGRARLPN